MIEIHEGTVSLLGSKGSIPVKEDDEITIKLAMLFEGQCEGLGPGKAAEKFGYTRQRYHQLLRQFMDKGAEGITAGQQVVQKQRFRSLPVLR